MTRLGSKPLVTFVFNYRPKGEFIYLFQYVFEFNLQSIDLLIANGIIQSAKLTQSKNIAKGKLKEEKDRGEEDAVSQLEVSPFQIRLIVTQRYNTLRANCSNVRVKCKAYKARSKVLNEDCPQVFHRAKRSSVNLLPSIRMKLSTSPEWMGKAVTRWS